MSDMKRVIMDNFTLLIYFLVLAFDNSMTFGRKTLAHSIPSQSRTCISSHT